MDAQRQYELKIILDRLSTASSVLHGLADEEETSFNLTPENIRQNPRAVAHQQASEILAEAATNVDDIVQALSLLLG